MADPLALRGALHPAPPCSVAPEDPRPLREWMVNAMLGEVVKTGALGPHLFVVFADRMIQADLPVLAPRAAADQGAAWGAIAAAPGALRTFRCGMMDIESDGAPRPCAVVLERLTGGQYWMAWWPLVPQGPRRADGGIRVDEAAGPSEAGETLPDRLAARWLEGFGTSTQEVSFGIPVAQPPPPGSPVYLKGAPLVAPLPRDIEGIATLLDLAMAQDTSLFEDAIRRPPVIVTIRNQIFERWILRTTWPITFDDLVRNLCQIGDDPPQVVITLQPGNILFRGEQRNSVVCVIESRRRRLIRHIPLVLDRGPDLWHGATRQRLREGEGWIGVKPKIDLHLHGDRTAFGGAPGEA